MGDYDGEEDFGGGDGPEEFEEVPEVCATLVLHSNTCVSCILCM